MIVASRQNGLGQVKETAVSMGVEAGTILAAGGGKSAVLGAFGGPVGLAITGAIVGLQMLWSKSKLAGARRIAATNIVNDIEPHLIANLNEYFSLSNRTEATKAEAIDNFHILWGIVAEACPVSELGQAGRRCVSDRERGGQFDWFARYLDPIMRDEPPGIELIPGLPGLPSFEGLNLGLIVPLAAVGAGLFMMRK